MKIIIAGSRDNVCYADIVQAMDDISVIPDEIVSGTARGADRYGEKWAKENDIPIKKFPAQWDLYGKSAGYKRNEEMALYADGLVAIWDGQSRGTKHMIDLAKEHGLKVYVYRTDKRR